MAIDLTSPTGQVRLLIPDRKEGQLRFSDDEIGAFLVMEDGNVKCAAALAIETIASDIAMTLLYIKTNEIETDGAKPADALRKRAKELRDQTVQAVEEEEDEDEWDFTNSC